MLTRIVAVTLVACLLGSWSFAQSSDTAGTYVVPRTEHGQPDFQGVWSTRFNTGLERPEGLPLVLSPEQAAGFAQAVAGNLDGNADPDIDRLGPPVLAVVNGEYRSSVIVHPENGVLPYNDLGARRSAHNYFEGVGFDGPEQRPGVERCTEAWGSPPMRAFMYQLFHGFVQTADTIAIVSEELASVRVIHLDGKPRPDAVRGFEGHSVGHWEGDTLVVETTHYSDANPERSTIARPMLISGEARVTERFTRTSETELNYQFSVDDPTYYTEPWRGEFSFTLEESDHIYEYACHEGNYAMEGALRGERVIEAQEEAAAAQPEARTISLADYQDKVAGGWLGQAVGVLFGAPTEFLWPGEIVPFDLDGFYRLNPDLYMEEARGFIEAQQYTEMLEVMKKYKNDRDNWLPYTPTQMTSQDDLYIEFLFLHSLQQHGLDVTGEQLAQAWLDHLDPNMIWGANKAAYENFEAGILPPRSGHPDHTSLGNAIDFQIESDLFGLISPGLPQASNRLGDTAGHLMNYGDGVYAGMAIAAMYGEAFFESDVRTLVEHSLSVIPAESGYAEMIHDVMAAHDANPDDWQAAWQVVFDKWGQYLGLDVRTNGACVYLGLLYGEGDLWKTMNISMRCGLDSDCNPSTSAGIVGTILGMSGIPEEWALLRDLPISNMSATRSRQTVEDIYPDPIQWDDIIAATVEVGRKNILANGGGIENGMITIPRQAPVVPPFERVP